MNNTSTLLNIGCSVFKIPGFINMDADPKVSPDLLGDIMEIDTLFPPNSVDYIMAGHVIEHFTAQNAPRVLEKCRKILKPFGNLMLVFPDYSKCTDLPEERAEYVILGGGQHLMLCNVNRMHKMLKEVGFHCVTEISNLTEVPFIVVPDMKNPKPEPWQSALLAFKLY